MDIHTAVMIQTMVCSGLPNELYSDKRSHVKSYHPPAHAFFT
jgi:hypothetical protein